MYGLWASDLDFMNDRETEHHVKKDNVWKKPDYQDMIDSGDSIGVVYYIKKVRDALGAAPEIKRSDNTPEKRLARQKQYVETLRNVQTLVEAVQSYEDCKRVFQAFFIENGYIRQRVGTISGGYEATDAWSENPVVTRKLFGVMQVGSESNFENKFTRKAQSEQFGVAKEDKVPKGYSLHFNDGKNTMSKGTDWKVGTWYVCKGYSILKANLQSKGEALKWAQETAKPNGRGSKTRFVPPQLKNILRDGADYRQDKDASGRDYLVSFGFRGGEFGNWMSDLDRQASLNMGFDALKDLAAVLGIADKDISLDGTLAIAFGSRGRGSAVAHYEPDRQVINLTKMRGAGSLAHEWWHALDDYLGQKFGASYLLSEQLHCYAEMGKLVRTIKFKTDCDACMTATDFYRNSKRMGQISQKDGSYWDSNTEMTARAFATYVMDKLACQSDYLVGHAECAIAPITENDGSTTVIRAYPEGEERKAINAAFDALFADLKANRVLNPLHVN